jgi:hypothetical protein
MVIIITHNAATGEITEKEATATQLKKIEEGAKETLLLKTKEAVKTSAMAKLLALGLTTDELQVLLG